MTERNIRHRFEAAKPYEPSTRKRDLLRPAVVVRARVFAAALAFAGLLGVLPAAADTPTPAPTVTPAPRPTLLLGFSARGTFVAEALINGSTAKFGAEVAVMNSKQRTRIDLLHIDLAGSDPTLSSVIGKFIPQGPMTVVLDQGSKTVTIWSEQKHAYFQTKMRPPTKLSPVPKATPEPKTSGESTSPFDQLQRAAKGLSEYDVLNQTLTLVGHQTINDHTATVLHFTLQSQKHGGKMQDVSGDLALADDLGIPVRLWITAKGDHEGSVKIDLVSVSMSPPDPSAFAVPAGYKQVKDFTQLVGRVDQNNTFVALLHSIAAAAL